MTIRSLGLASILAAIAACGAPASEGEERVGAATAEITQVPAQVACVDIHVSGASKTTAQKFDVTPGGSSILPMTGLPTGNVTFNALAYSAACSAVASSTTATWVSEAVPATLTAGTPVSVNLVMKKNGAANVGIDFPEDDGTPPGLSVSLAAIEFGDVTCATSAVPINLTITNTTAQAQPITGAFALGASSPFKIASSAMTVPPQASFTFKVESFPLTFIEPGLHSDVLKLSTDPTHAFAVPVTMTAKWAVLAFSPANVSGLAASATTPVSLVNSGNVPITVSLSAALLSAGSGNYQLTPSTGTIPPGGALASILKNNSAAMPEAEVTISTTPGTGMCHPPPKMKVN